LLAGALAAPGLAAAQQDQPEIMPGERRPVKRKATGPRALAILQLGANGKTSLLPVAILIDGKFWDASSYKADPIPMALEPGTVYEAERTGNSLGLFTVGSALHSNAVNAPVPWLATGIWHPTGSESKTVEAKAESAPKGIEDADRPPRLTRDPNAVNAAPASSGGSTPASTPSSGDKPRSSDSDEPPRLTKGSSPPPSEPPPSPPSAGQSPNTPPATSAPASTSGSGSKPGDAKTDTTKTADRKADDKSTIPASDSGTSEANRPRLRRGKPAESFADEDVPGYSKPGAKLDANAGKVVATPAATPSDVQLIPAISDAAPSQLRPFTFDWLKGEEDDRRKQMVALAKEQLRAYIEARAKNNTASRPAHAAAAHRAALPEPVLETVQMSAYDVWRSNQPVMVLSAKAHMPPAPAGSAHSEYDSELQYSLVIVAYPDIYNNLHQLYASVTDKFHLDMTPRLELIDAVDVDGDGYGDLLFRETTDQGTGWAIYRPTADRLWKMYDSLSPEG
jgi:hypothetical protein